jgi:spore coat polysaccharide biosynthesis predicted glycosyltransferase SpsG
VRILLRCDGDGRLGVGHVIRSLALAEAAVAAGHEVVVAGHFEGSFLAGQLSAAPVEVVQLGLPAGGADPQPLVDLAQSLRLDVLHVDSYEISGQLGGFVTSGLVLSNVEDGTFGRRPADVVVDPTFGAERSPRLDDGSTWLLRGSRYMPVRQRVLDARRGDPPAERDAHTEAARTVLVVMGGTDPVGLAPAAVKLLVDTCLALEVTVIAVGEDAERVRAAARCSRVSLNVLAPVDDLPAMMAEQDLVISAAGTSVWELCCIGVPMAVVWAVDNQREGYDRVVAAGAAVGLGGPGLAGPKRSGDEQAVGLGGPGLAGPERSGDEQAVGLGGPDLSGDVRGGDEPAVGLLRTALTDSRVRADLVLAGRHIVDGLGAWRVVRMWEQAERQKPGLGRPVRPVAAAGLVARPATLEDARQLWEWRNDPGTRAGSRHGEMVPWLEHLAWVEASLTREDRVLLVVDDPLGPVGTVRWDLAGEGEWEVSITVAPDRRGRSLARSMLQAAEAAPLEVATLPDEALSEVARSEVARSEVARSEVARSEVARSEVARSEVARSEVAGSEVAGSEVTPSGVGRSRGTGVTAYLAVVHVDNHASVRLFETSGYVPDLPPDSRGFLRFRKAAPVT